MNESSELERQFRRACSELAIRENDRLTIESFLAPLRDKASESNFHFLHSLRVGLLVRDIARFERLEERPLFMAGVLHDLGKCQVALEVLGKTEGWTRADTQAMRRHVLDGYRMIRGRFDFSAEVMVLHHTHQPEPYPKRLPSPLHAYSRETRDLIEMYGRRIALADVYDALHRVNDKFGESRALSDQEIRDHMLEFNPDVRELVLALYEAGIFVT